MSDATPSPMVRPLRVFAAFFGPGNPFVGPGAWRRAVGDQVARVQAVTDELARVEARNVALARMLIDETARFSHASLTWSTQLSAAWHGMMAAAAQQTLDAVTPRDR